MTMSRVKIWSDLTAMSENKPSRIHIGEWNTPSKEQKEILEWKLKIYYQEEEIGEERETQRKVRMEVSQNSKKKKRFSWNIAKM